MTETGYLKINKSSRRVTLKPILCIYTLQSGASNEAGMQMPRETELKREVSVENRCRGRQRSGVCLAAASGAAPSFWVRLKWFRPNENLLRQRGGKSERARVSLFRAY
jgi:hypothetical protein